MYNSNICGASAQCIIYTGLIPVLKQALLKSHAKGNTVRAALCYEGMVHVKAEFWDSGWGCGYVVYLLL